MATKEADKWEKHMGKKPGTKTTGPATEIHRPTKKKPIEGKKVETKEKKAVQGKTIQAKPAAHPQHKPATAPREAHTTHEKKHVPEQHGKKEVHAPEREAAPTLKEASLSEKVEDLAILKHPLVTEKAVNMIEESNKLTFVVDSKATKQDIKKAVEGLYKARVKSINTLRDMRARKRAIVTLDKSVKAGDIATKLGVI